MTQHTDHISIHPDTFLKDTEPAILPYTEKTFTKEQVDAYNNYGHSATITTPGTGIIIADADEIARTETPAKRDPKVDKSIPRSIASSVSAPVNPNFLDMTDTRNVADEFKGMPDEQIREILNTRRSKMVSIMMNLSSDYNKATCIRTANALSISHLHFINRVNEQNPDSYTGVKRYDRRGTTGTHVYERVENTSIAHWQDVYDDLHAQGYTIFAVDNIMEYNPESVYDVEFPELSAFVFGEEGIGLKPEMIEAADRMIYINQTGSVRSMNVSVTMGIITAFYTAQHRQK